MIAVLRRRTGWIIAAIDVAVIAVLLIISLSFVQFFLFTDHDFVDNTVVRVIFVFRRRTSLVVAIIQPEKHRKRFAIGISGTPGRNPQ